MEPTLITRAGSAGLAAASSRGSSARVRWNSAFTFSASTLSQAASGYSSMGAPQLAPALFTRMCRAGSRSPSASASSLAADSLERSAGSAWHVPSFESSAATSWQTSALRDAT